MPLSLGKTFYAAGWGSDANPGTFESPWRSLEKANGLLPGEKLVLRAGNYGGKGQTFNWWAGLGEPDRPTTIEGFPGERPIVEGKINFIGPWKRWANTYFRGPTGPTAGPGPGGESNFVNLEGEHLELLNSEVAYCQWHAGVSGSDARDYRILGCYLHDNGGLNGDFTTADAQWNTSHGAYLSPSSFGLVANSLIEHNDAKGLMARHDAHNLIFVHNTIVWQGRSGISTTEFTHDWITANNLIVGNGVGKNGHGLSTHGSTIGPTCLSRRNVFWNNGWDGVDHWSGAITSSEPLIADPRFVRPIMSWLDHQDPAPAWDWRLLPDSPAIGYADPFYGMPFDIDGRPRTSRFDCGAYQAA